jgi:hypothetical protein
MPLKKISSDGDGNTTDASNDDLFAARPPQKQGNNQDISHSITPNGGTGAGNNRNHNLRDSRETSLRTPQSLPSFNAPSTSSKAGKSSKKQVRGKTAKPKQSAGRNENPRGKEPERVKEVAGRTKDGEAPKSIVSNPLLQKFQRVSKYRSRSPSHAAAASTSVPTVLQTTAATTIAKLDHMPRIMNSGPQDEKMQRLHPEEREVLEKTLQLMYEASHPNTADSTKFGRKRPFKPKTTPAAVAEPVTKKQKFRYVEQQTDPHVGPIEDNRPKQIRYGQHPLEDRDDRYFHMAIGRLESQIEDFSEIYFCFPTTYTVDTDNNNPWDAGMGPEFLRFAELVAEPDPHMGGWNRFMTDLGQRKWFLVGILARVLETRVFNELLFGATKPMNDMLVTMEKTLVTLEGMCLPFSLLLLLLLLLLLIIIIIIIRGRTLFNIPQVMNAPPSVRKQSVHSLETTPFHQPSILPSSA